MARAGPRKIARYGDRFKATAVKLSSLPGVLIKDVADDVKPGKRTSFPRSVKLKPSETVVFAYVVYNSRAHRDRVNAKVMKDKRIAPMMDPKAMPFDAKRMFWGGFKVLVDA